MKTTIFAASAAYLLSGAAAQQFVMYTPLGDDTAVERADPILSPGKISQHVHQILGSDAFAPSVSYDSLQQGSCTTVGDSSGNGNAADNSAYWHPALYMEANDGSGWIKIPTSGHKFYYKNAGVGTPRSPFEFPHGFRMLAGNPFMRGPDPNLQRQNITQWICHDSSGNNQGTSGGFPTGVTDCDAYPGFNGAVHFPHCWNGDDFNPTNPTAHVVYPTGDIENGECPSSHPTRLPHIFVENQFDLHSMVGKVKQDTFTLAMGDNTGYGWHFDFFNGWKDGAIPELLKTCPQGDYGNEDIGLCPSFEKSSVSNDDCKLKTSFVEKVDAPGKNLPGCNPVSDKNPAPFYETVPLGTYSTDCTLLSEGPPSHGPPEGPPSHGHGHGPHGINSAHSALGSVLGKTATSTASQSAIDASSTLATMTKPTSAPAQTTTSAAASSSDVPPSYEHGGHGHGHGHGSQSTDMSCPASNGKSFAMNGKTFQVECDIDHAGGDMKMVTVHSLGECVNACAMTDGCVDVSLSGVACYMKKSMGQQLNASGISGAKLVGSGSTGKAHRHSHAAKHARGKKSNVL